MMKKLLFVLLSCLMASAFCACSDDDEQDYEKACKYLVSISGTNDFEMEFNHEEASAAKMEAATDLCVEEIKGLPYCSNEYIALYSCEYAAASQKLDAKDTEAYRNAMKKCETDHPDCKEGVDSESAACRAKLDCEINAHGTYHPCGIADDARERCMRQSDAIEQAIHAHIDSYYHRYKSI